MDADCDVSAIGAFLAGPRDLLFEVSAANYI